MRFTMFFAQDFLSENNITLSKVIAKEDEKTFTMHFKFKQVLSVNLFEEFQKGLAKLERELRRYKVIYQYEYDDLMLTSSNLYLDYYRYLLAHSLDYQIMNLINLNVQFKNGCFKFILTDSKKVTDEAIGKIKELFLKYGLQVDFECEVINKEEVLAIKEEQQALEEAEMFKQIEEHKENAKREQKLEEIQKKPRRYAKSSDEVCEPIANIPATQSGIDECINTTGSSTFTIEGEVFAIESRKLAKATLYQIAIYDGTDSIMIKKFAKTDVDKELYDSIKKDDIIRVTGLASYDMYAREVTITANKFKLIGKKTVEERKDLALEKRVELHLHSNMSALDAISPIGDYISQAVKWGHKAIAITDHDGVYSFHDLMVGVKGKDIKPIYGVELGFVDEKKFNIAYTEADINLKDATYVVFDLETTGFSVTYDEIIQIGARKVHQGQTLETFEVFVKPSIPIPGKITELTTISAETVKDAEMIDVILPRFIEFIGDAILVAQNASFDMGHLYANMKKLGLPDKKFPVIDTMQLARNFYANDLKYFNLKALARYFKIQQEHHHLADDDTRVTTEIFLQMLQTLYKNNIYNYQEINKSINYSEAYKHVVPSHINLLVKNQVGYKNLFKIVSDSLTNHFHNGSRCLKSVLDSLREGILVGSGCANGEVFELALNKSEEELKEAIKYYDYIEVQPPKIYICSLERDEYKDIDYEYMVCDTIKKIIRVSKELGKMVVATSDCHYLHPNQKEYRDIYISCPQLGGGIHPLARCVNTPPQHFRSTDEMLVDFGFLGPDLAHEIVVTNPNLIADMVEEIVAFKEGKDALYSPADDEFKDSLKVPSIKDDLIRLVYEKAYADYGNPLPQYVQDRLNKELDSIIKNGFSPVYYMAYLLVAKSNSDGYVVGSRGSVGSSFVATMMKITEVNPLAPHYFCRKCHFTAFKFTEVEKEKYGLTKEQSELNSILQSVGSGYDLPDQVCPCCGNKLSKDGQDIPFETFLGFSGDKTPDIDLNFSGDYQPYAHEYIRTLMGPENAFRAGTVTTVAENTAIGYVKGHLERKEITKRNTEIIRIAKNLEGVRRSTGQHPGGIVVVPSYKDIYDVTPIQYPADKTDNNWRTTHFDYHQFEANLLKLDILGHDDPTTLRYLFDYVEAHPEEFPFSTPQEIPVDDPLIYKMFNETEVLGLKPEDIGCEVATFAIPEFGTRFTRQMLIDTKPKNFSDLVKISGLSHGTDVWANNCQNLVLGTTEFGKIPFSEVIGCRDDIMVYLIENGLQPKMAFDIMEFVRKGKAAKHSDPEKWSKYINAMNEHNIPNWYSWSCERIAYMFPKAHAVAYVLMAVRIAWFKIHKPLLFYSAFFSIRASQFEPDIMLAGISKIRSRIEELSNLPKSTVKDEDLLTMYQVATEMLKRGFKFLQVDINKSHAKNFLIEGDALRLPFVAIPGLGESVAIDIMEKRNEKPFASHQDVQKRTKLNKTLYEKMVNLGSFGDLKEEEDVMEQGLFAL